MAGMDAWNAWGRKAAAAIVDMGAPLGKTLAVTAKGASAARNDLGGYSILQGESKEQIGELLKGHERRVRRHRQRPSKSHFPPLSTPVSPKSMRPSLQ